VKLTTLPPSCAAVMKSGKLNFLETSGPLQACNGTDLPFTSFFQIFSKYVITNFNAISLYFVKNPPPITE